VEAIVLGAEEPSRIRGGSRFGGRGGPMENFVGEATKQVIAKARCRVIVTAPAARDTVAVNGEGAAPGNPSGLSPAEPVADPPIV
jgi:APA family basic amino acid/polyamine antiporter